MMSYEKSVPCSGNPASAIEVARTVLLGQGFSVNRFTPTSIEATSPWMTSSHQPALRGVSSIRIEIHGSTLTLTAGLRNMTAMILFILLFPPLLVLLVALFQGNVRDVGRACLIFLVVCPLASVWMWFRTRSALNNLVRNMQNAAGTRVD